MFRCVSDYLGYIWSQPNIHLTLKQCRNNIHATWCCINVMYTSFQQSVCWECQDQNLMIKYSWFPHTWPIQMWQLPNIIHFSNTKYIFCMNITEFWTLQRFQWTLCLLGNFTCFFCRLLIFFKINFFRKILSGIPSVSNSFGSGLTIWMAWLWSNLLAKIISWRQKSIPAGKKKLKVLIK